MRGMRMSAPGPRPRDAVLVGILAAAAVLEGWLRPDLDWRIAVTAVTVATLALLPWRRTHPLLVTAVAAALNLGFTCAQLVAGAGPDSLAAALGGILVPYALFRWGSGRATIVGAVIFGFGVAVSVITSGEGLPAAVAAVAFVGGACLAGALRRERVAAGMRQTELVRAQEREALARDLHDTVAHHVTGIAIHAQAASRATGTPAVVSESLAVIEREAAAALVEMRSLVSTLRSPADYAPGAGLPELEALASDGPPRVTVRLDVTAPLPDVVAATLFRLAQEGVTNARRHARGATSIDVAVTASPAEATVTVHDDGAARPGTAPGSGLRGMSERVALLGGTFDAGPHADGGWQLRATLPLGSRR